MKYSICVDAVFAGCEVEESIRLLEELDLKAVEFWSWWDDKKLEKIEDFSKAGMEISALCNRFISLVDERERDNYVASLKETLAIADRVGAKNIITQVGNDIGIERALQKRNLVTGLKACVPFLEDANKTLLIEPLNTAVDHEGYYLESSQEAFDIVKDVASPYVKVLFDIYHQQISEGNIISRITSNIGWIGHFHAAGIPGRNELCFGELDYTQIFSAIENTGYAGYIGLEYFPKNDARFGLERLPLLK